MEYKLAKQLKDLGFTQNEWNGVGSYLSSFGIPKKIFVDEFSSEVAYIPTLSELIEACGDEFQLTRWDESVWDGLWVASTEIYYDDAGYVGDIGEGKTPEEAVAKLYIKLNNQ